ncbi:MAG: hypothetical protein KDB27_22155 [Planctomycetales bacterium]|nr:hypothetical protein [Planctomycetales bacterium]
MTQLFLRADDVLRRRRWTTDEDKPWSSFVTLIRMIVFFGFIYGATMGSYELTSIFRLKQSFYSAVKVPLLLAVTFGISLPSFYVINMLLGLSDDFRAAVRALIATQAGIAIVLASLAPVTALWYFSTTRYDTAIVFNAAMFAIASVSGQWLMRRYYAPLIETNPRHRLLLWTWICVYALVGIQMGWILRPFIGTPGTETQFLRVQEWDNAYVTVGRLIWQSLSR